MKLGELISIRQADLGLSLEKLAQRARQQGYELTKTTLSTFVNHPLSESPRRRTMEALAVAIGVEYGEVVVAVAESMVGDDGPMTEVTNAPHVRSWLTLTEGRSDEEVASMLRVVRTVADALDVAAHPPLSDTGEGASGDGS